MADYIDRQTDNLVRQIVRGRASFQTSQPGGSGFMPENMNGTPFRAGNALALAAAAQEKGFTDTRWVPRQRAELLGATVRAGERGTPIQYWQIKNGSAPTMTTAVVFNAEQYNNLPARTATIIPMADRAKRVAAIVEGSNSIIQRSPDNHGWDRSADIIRIHGSPAVGPYVTSQQQEIVKYLSEQTAHPSRMGRDLDPTQEQFRTTIATMLASDRLKIGYEGNQDPKFARDLVALVQDRTEIGRASMIGERIAQEVVKYEQARSPELTANKMQELARKTLSPAERQAELRQQAWQAATAPSSQDRASRQSGPTKNFTSSV